MYAKSIYVQSAAAQIRRITAENKDPEVVRDKVRRAGGVSIAGGVIGGIIQFLGLAAVIFSTFLARKYGLR
jgi:prolipoprotein diacylglyceryltransferase